MVVVMVRFNIYEIATLRDDGRTLPVTHIFVLIQLAAS